jgi:hypothetical protein
MGSNDVGDLVEIPNGAKRLGCKWVYKTKYDSRGNVERFKERLIKNESLQCNILSSVI